MSSTGGGFSADTAIAGFVDGARDGPRALFVEGEAGIGKTTLWLRICEQARRQGFRILAGSGAQGETVMAYATIADLLSAVEPDTIDGLPDVQRLALHRVAAGAGGKGPATDHQVVAAAFVAVVTAVGQQGSVLVAVEDVQWLDASSRSALAFAARRLKGPVGLLVSERCDSGQGQARSWLRLNSDAGSETIRVRPLALAGLHTVLLEHLGRALSPPMMAHIAKVSGGNPFYALEIARALDGQDASALSVLPRTLGTLVQSRIGRFDPEAKRLLLAVASAAAPTVDVLIRVADCTAEHVATVLEAAENDGVITIEGNRLRFCHPLLAHGTYTDATPAERRDMHRALAAVEEQPELRARHLALAATTMDETTLAALDEAADRARQRGAPAAAAELLDLALGRGGDTSWRTLRASGDHFRAGDTDKARALLEPCIDRLEPGPMRAIGLSLLAAIHMYDNHFVEARNLLARAVGEARNVPAVAVQSLMSLSFAQGMGSFAENFAGGMFEESLGHARQARDIASEHAAPAMTSRALAMWAHANFQYGNGVDEVSLARALELEDPTDDAALPFSASAVAALIHAWTGRLDEARATMALVHRRYLERGDERNLMSVASYNALFEMWRGNLADAVILADEAVERAEQLGGGHVALIPLSVRAAVTAHLGLDDDARADARMALGFAHQCDAPRMTEWPIMTLGFLDVSRGDYRAALTTLQPMLSRFGVLPGIEIMHGWYLADAVEAMVAVGRLEDAETLTTVLEADGQRLNRQWMKAAGARCRGMLLAAGGALDDAETQVRQSVAEYAGVSMPFDRARSELLLGQLLRRLRRREAARTTLGDAMATFEGMGARVWADRARVELSRVNEKRTPGASLTPAEKRVADLAASGMRNSEIAAELFIAVKTVELRLTGIYRKLGIRSRTELARSIESASYNDDVAHPDRIVNE